jgi:hypothetical protein
LLSSLCNDDPFPFCIALIVSNSGIIWGNENESEKKEQNQGRGQGRSWNGIHHLSELSEEEVKEKTIDSKTKTYRYSRISLHKTFGIL